MGRSGSGKSTLLHILGGMDSVTSGQYLWDDKDISGLDVKGLEKFRKEHVSFVFQNYMLMNSYTVFENIEVPLIARGVKAKQRKVYGVSGNLRPCRKISCSYFIRNALPYKPT